MYKRKQTLERSEKIKQQKTVASKTNNEPWMQIFSDAREAFNQNQFKDSVALFTRALSLKPNHITLLDCRAASYEKLNEMELATRDAVQMVKLASTDARGYLRLGKILSLEKKYDKAIHIYTRALDKVSPQDKRYNQIVAIKAIAEKKAKSDHVQDFMNVLPYDIISLIFSKLSFDRRIQCTAVSRNWRAFALNWSGMWRDLEFGHQKISLTTIKNYLGYAKGRHVRRFAIMDVDQNKMKKILQLLIDENCQYIEILDFVRCEIPLTLFLRMLRLVGKHVQSIRIDEGNLTVVDVIKYILPACPHLTHLSMIGIETGSVIYDDLLTQPLPNLTHLRLSINDDITLAKWILNKCNNLSFLDFYTFNINFIDLAETFTDPVLLSSLKTLNYTFGSNYQIKTQWYSTVNAERQNTQTKKEGLEAFGIYGDLSFTGPMLELIIRKWYKSLKQLTIVDCRSLDNTLARLAIEPGLPCIEILSINACISLEEWNLHSIISSCPTIQDLSISWNPGVTDSIMNDLAEVTKELKRLDITHCNNVTGVGLHKLVQSHHRTLEKLILNNCQRIGIDAVNWAIELVGRRVIECKFNT
ncbi:uncharacterized protein BX663DRAFT_452479 [Cokeromyces recurvatus]|uniref:uncharacterized protein n=1 Tax=Cokeromyces recurvatus TaxID=90255 RepID=UPI00221EA6E0|nr:uncharacterized protein BX663DRAFT_452479 [Cokeromyces recurvatus]KAI7903868.1 hypothetical protein BX663DRAFT_452479 [Cokeromyces recurvatus]